MFGSFWHRGSVLDPYIVFPSLFVLIWQIPHFWLLMLFYGKEYEAAGFPTLYRVFSEHNLRLWTLGWIVTTVFAGLFLPYFGIIKHDVSLWIIAALSISMLVVASMLLFKYTTANAKKLFHWLNLYMTSVILCVLFDKL